MWICDYLIPSTRFHLTANQTLASTISALEGAITKYIKKWLKLSGNATWAIIHHPSVVKTPSLASVKVRAKLSLLTSFSRSTNPTVMDMENILNDSAFLWRNDVNQEIQDLIQEADQGRPATSLQTTIRKLALDKKKEKCTEKLPRVQVQSKFTNIVALKEETTFWSRIMNGLPKGQFPFLLKAGSNTLPTPVNLHRWHLRVSPSCPLCNRRMCTTTSCPAAHCPPGWLLHMEA